MNYFTSFCAFLLIFCSHSIFGGSVLRVPQSYSKIQLAVNAANAGDTIIVSPGYYKENIAISKPLTLRSEIGAESTIIEDPAASSSWGSADTRVISVSGSGTGVIKGFTIIGKRDVNGAGIYVDANSWEISGCIISNNHFGINTYNASTVIKNNIVTSNSLGIGSGLNSEITGNIITENDDGIYAYGHTGVYNNLISDSFTAVNGGGSYDTPAIYNNVITTTSLLNASSQQTGIRLGGYYCRSDIKNNIVAYCGRDGIFSSSGGSGFPDEFKITYNNIFDNNLDYGSLVNNKLGVDGNISDNPFFCDNDKLFFLASDSPCIDSGDPALKDIDNSRSDIGMFGGPHAKELRYAPASFDLILPKDSAVINPAGITLKWEGSFDRNQNDQVTYRIIVGRSLIETYTNARHAEYKISMVQDTFYTTATQFTITKTLTDSVRYYWNVEAADNGGLFKRSHRTLSFFTSSAVSDIKDREVPGEFTLYQNYPNPFNPETTIRYSLAEDTNVELIVYDMLGREVKTLISSFQGAGMHSVKFDGSSLPSGLYIYTIQAGQFSDSKKLLLLK